MNGAEAITCPKEEILRRLQRETTCSACCNALRVMMERRLSELPLLVSFVEREDEAGSYVLRDSLASSEALEAACAKFPLHEWLKNCQPLKRDKRCPMHTNSRNIFNQADLWEDMWAELSTAQKSSICGVAAEELHDKLWQHCTDKHHLCKDCRNNVMWGFDKLTKKCDAIPPHPHLLAHCGHATAKPCSHGARCTTRQQYEPAPTVLPVHQFTQGTGVGRDRRRTGGGAFQLASLF
jgi:hypothetical protein